MWVPHTRVFFSLFMSTALTCPHSCGSIWLPTCLHPSYPLQCGLFSTLSSGESVLPAFGSFSRLFILMWVLARWIRGTRWAEDPPPPSFPEVPSTITILNEHDLLLVSPLLILHTLTLHKEEKFPLTLLWEEEPYFSKYRTIEEKSSVIQVSYLKLKNWQDCSQNYYFIF